MFFLFIIFIHGVSSVNMTNIIGPSSVQNGSTSYLVLDCPFDTDESERQGLVVKWYLNQNPVPVYQWIPGHQPQDFGVLRGRLDLTHEASAEKWSKHRALAILNPTTDLTGKYTCKISTFLEEDSRTMDLVVFAPAVKSNLSYSKPSKSSVVLHCDALGLYPQPTVSVYRKKPYSDRTHRSVISEPELSTEIWKGRSSYDVTARVTLFDFELNGETIFLCEVSIPGTKYVLQKELYYSPDRPLPLISLSSGSTRVNSPTIFSTLWILGYLLR